MAPRMAMFGPGGPCMAEGDHPWRHGWSDRTMYGAIAGPAGPTVEGTIYGMALHFGWDLKKYDKTLI